MKAALLPIDDRRSRGPVTASEWQETFKLIRAGFERQGLRFPENCRLAEYERAVTAAISGHPDDSYPSPDLFTHALLETRQLRLIARHLCPLAVPGLTDLLRKVIKGHAIPADEQQHTKGRDAQFELFLAASLASVGCAVSFEEPDIIVQDGANTLAVAAKRLKSDDLVSTNIKKANRQMVKAGRRGIVALDITCLAGVPRMLGPFSGRDPFERSRRVIHRFGRQILEKNGLGQHMDPRYVSAVLVCYMQRVSATEERLFGTTIDWQFVYLPVDRTGLFNTVEALRRRFVY